MSKIKKFITHLREKVNLKKKKEKIKIDINSLTSKEIEEELKRTTYSSKYIKVLRSTIYALIIIAALAILVATLFMPVFQISTSSMAPRYNTGDFVVSIKTSKLKSGDIIAFYHGNKILIKRVIAKQGQWVVIDEKGNVYVDGVQLKESYVSEKTIGNYDIKFPYQVPEESWFVLSDNRSDSLDSRSSEIGCVKESNIIGKILFKIWDSKK